MTTATTSTIVLSADDKTAKALVATIRAAVGGVRRYAAYVAEHEVTRENVKQHADALAALTYPNDKPIVTVLNETTGKRDRTRFGNAQQAARKGLLNALDPVEDDDDKPVNLLTAQGVESLSEWVADGGDIEHAIHAIRAEIARRNA